MQYIRVHSTGLSDSLTLLVLLHDSPNPPTLETHEERINILKSVTCSILIHSLDMGE